MAEIIEIIAVVTGLCATWLFIKQRMAAWWWGIASVLAYLWVVWQVKLLANFILFLILLILQGYGWYCWTFQGSVSSRAATPLSYQKVLWVSLIGLLGYLSLALLLQGGTEAELVWWDSLATVVVLFAQWLLARKSVWTWVFWFLSNIIYVGIYYHQALYFTVGLYVLYIGLSIKGYQEWRVKPSSV